MLPQTKPYKRLIYLDHAATTYLDSRVEQAMQPFWKNFYGNPSSLYKKGRESLRAIETARKTIADFLHGRPGEIIFTAGATESVNLAIFGIARQYELIKKQKGHIISSAIEHHAVLRSLDALKQEGWDTTLVNVDEQGFIKLDELKRAVRNDTVLISVIYANNEIGTIEPIREIGKWLALLNTERAVENLPKIAFHTDAAQAAGSLDVNVNYLGVDLLSLSGSKIYGPKQTGLLYVRSGLRLQPLIYGGGQEKNLRSGTENVPGIVGLAEALRLAQQARVKENKRLRQLRDYFLDQLFKKIPSIVLNGADERGLNIIDDDGQKKKVEDRRWSRPLRLPNNVNISFVGAEAEALLLYLDSYNIAVSTGSACTSASLDPSHVILAISRFNKERADSSIRFTLGKQTTKKDLNYVIKVLPDIIAQLRRINPASFNSNHRAVIEKAFLAKNKDNLANKKLKTNVRG